MSMRGIRGGGAGDVRVANIDRETEAGSSQISSPSVKKKNGYATRKWKEKATDYTMERKECVVERRGPRQ